MIGRRFLVLSALVVLAVSCQTPTSEAAVGGRVRATLVSALTLAPELKVWVEGSDGLFLTGAKVLVTSPSGSVTLVGYAPGQGCFDAVFSNQGDGTYSITVDSLAWGHPLSLAVPHQVLRVPPNLTSVTDGVSEVFSGHTLDRTKPWIMAWVAVPQATSYFVQITQGTSVLWSATTTTPVARINPEALPSGTLSATIIAQYSAGDPLMETASYSSVSHSSSATLTIHAN